MLIEPKVFKLRSPVLDERGHLTHVYRPEGVIIFAGLNTPRWHRAMPGAEEVTIIGRRREVRQEIPATIPRRRRRCADGSGARGRRDRWRTRHRGGHQPASRRQRFAVAVNYSRSADDANAVVAEIEDFGGRAIAVQADISRSDEAVALVARTTEQLGTPTALVNNAGFNLNSSARRLTPQEWDRVIGINLSGAFYCTHAALPGGMYDAGWGRVVFLGSPSGGRELMPTMAPYAAAKAGLEQMGAVLAKEVARRGITVNTIIPGFVATDIIKSGGDDAADVLAARWPRIPAEAIANTIGWLMTDQAAYVSGEAIGVWLGGPV